MTKHPQNFMSLAFAKKTTVKKQKNMAQIHYMSQNTQRQFPQKITFVTIYFPQNILIITYNTTHKYYVKNTYILSRPTNHAKQMPTFSRLKVYGMVYVISVNLAAVACVTQRLRPVCSGRLTEPVSWSCTR